jgi:hypothetical protein
MNTSYRFVAVPQMEGATTLEVPAGELNLAAQTTGPNGAVFCPLMNGG